MTIQPSNRPNDAFGTPQGGIYDLPVVGSPARSIRRFYDDLQPTDEDSAGVALGKNTIRYGTVAAAGAAGAAVAAVLAL